MTKNFSSETLNIQNYDLVCFSHLRWDFVYQRPQHLMSRFAKERRVFFIEEPVSTNDASTFVTSIREDNLHLITPHFNESDVNFFGKDVLMRKHLDILFRKYEIKTFVSWYYTPMAMEFTNELKPKSIVYDCMDELSLFKFAPPELVKNEKKLFEIADVVFTGGKSLYEVKKDLNKNVWAFPSSIDVDHFKRARNITEDPVDQSNIRHPRLGYFGVIDERIDLKLLEEMADKRPDWHIVMIGPTAKVEDADLPRRENIHYLGMKQYAELPQYVAGWDVALMPFMMCDATRFISPTKTPEYLAAGKAVISTPVPDVVRPYKEESLVAIAETSDEFIAYAEIALADDRTQKLLRVDRFLAQNSWDKTWRRMSSLIDEAVVGQRRTKIMSAAAGGGSNVAETEQGV